LKYRSLPVNSHDTPGGLKYRSLPLNSHDTPGGLKYRSLPVKSHDTQGGLKYHRMGRFCYCCSNYVMKLNNLSRGGATVQAFV
jgi:hypothetical protein